MTPAEYIRTKLSEDDRKTFDAALADVAKDLQRVNFQANLSSYPCCYCGCVNDPEDAGREFERFGYFLLGEKGVLQPFHLICAKKALAAWAETKEKNIMARLYAAEGVIQTLVLQAECSHDAEPDFCDNCAFEREGRSAAALAEWRKAVPESEVTATPPS